MTSEQYIEQLSAELKKLGGMLPLGFEYVRLTGQSPYPGGVDYMGQTATRAMYADLWAWLNENKPDAIVSEEEWQALYASQNGNVAKYSTGNGSTTFRFPRVVGYFKGADSVDDVGKYIKEGLPDHDHTRGTMDIYGKITYITADEADISASSYPTIGAFKWLNEEYSSKATLTSNSAGSRDLEFRASRDWTGSTSLASESDPIYGSSSHVTPEAITVVMGVIAFGVVGSIGEVIEEGVVTELSEHGAKLGELGADMTSLRTGVYTLASGAAYVPIENSAAAHNGVYRGKNLTGIYTLDQLSAKVQVNDWSDLYIGDSIEVPMTSTRGGAETVRWLFAGFDWYMNVGDTPFNQHHIVMVPENCFKDNAQMNSTNTTEGAYKGSSMYQSVLPDYAAALKASGSFGSHVANYRAILTKTMTSTVASGACSNWQGASTDWEWTDCDIRMMTEVEVYGSRVLSSSFYDVGIGNRQLPLFQLAPQYFVCGCGLNKSVSVRLPWWLSAVRSSLGFAVVDENGEAFGLAASLSCGIRPLFLFV